ncbi:filamin A-interacting protein 1-like isoform X1 [Carcharodon carcharias]|uniref:filamin A-interacting protein 1-like isoform X1 n=1 Tax=Carcharodon carcharias TaxID=13397 RepID=UPI001B7E0F67|nr:filamin A-interacting protein 1-like isoform X1 [Carcharodon carcharias]
MRSRSNSLESSSKTKRLHQRARSRHRNSEKDGLNSGAVKMNNQRERVFMEEAGTVLRNHKTRTSSKKHEDLSRDDLLFLLSILEGELEARDEVITVLKAEKIDLALLEAQYGFVMPKKVLQALQRDTIQAKADSLQEDIYEKPMVELDKIVEKQKETHRRMLEQLLLVERSHRQTVNELEDEKKKHVDYMEKSDEFTNLLEQERERLKKLIDQEKAYQVKKDQENVKKITKLKEELTKLKSFALILVDEQQRLSEQLNQQSQKVQVLSVTAQQAQEKLTASEERATEEENKVFTLEIELQAQASRFYQEQETTMAKLTNEESQNRQLRLKLATLSRQIDELEETNKSLKKAEGELQDLREKINRGECGNSSLMAEVEDLRKRVLEMEGKDEELLKMEDQCRDLNRKIEKEESHSRNLKTEVEKLKKRIMELEKLEDAFSKSKQECYVLKCNLEKEKNLTKKLENELETLKVRVRELEAIENKLEKTELAMKEDLSKLKTLTVMLVDERKTMAEKMRQTEDKFQNASTQLQIEENKVTVVTEKLIEESKKALKSKAELEEKTYSLTKERDELKKKLKTEEERGNDLLSKSNLLKKRLQSLEAVEKEYLKNKGKQESGKSPKHFQQDDNKVRELTHEVERLKHKLKEMQVVEDDLMKTEDDYDSLEHRYYDEQQELKLLSGELEAVKKELARYKLAEKAESTHEQILFDRLSEEQAKSSHLTREVEALKDKIHDYMATDDLLCHFKAEQTSLQKKLTQQENRNKELSRETENLTKELERYRRFSKSLRPGMNGRRFGELQFCSKEIQTDALDNEPPDYRSLIPLEKAVVNGKICIENEEADYTSLDDQSLQVNYNSLTVNSVNNKKSWIPWMKSKETCAQNGKAVTKQNGNLVQPGEMVLTQKQGQPLHIKVTPDHGHSTATLEITSPTLENPFSYTSTAVIPNCGVPKQRITIIQNASITPVKSKPSDAFSTPDRALTPLTRTTVSKSRTPDSCGSITPERTLSPIQIVAVTASSSEQALSPEPTEVATAHTIFRVSPERIQGRQIQKSNTSPNVITTEDNKIHIHLGNPHIQTASPVSRPMSPCSSIQEIRTPAITNGTPNKSTNKITSSITITPTATPAPRHSQITVAQEHTVRHSFPTRIPKPRSSTIKLVRMPDRLISKSELQSEKQSVRKQATSVTSNFNIQATFGKM